MWGLIGGVIHTSAWFVLGKSSHALGPLFLASRGHSYAAPRMSSACSRGSVVSADCSTSAQQRATSFSSASA
jgi:hypothetical protein